jgi:hypothetical protein
MAGPKRSSKHAKLDPESLTIVRAEVVALHGSVQLTGPQPTGSLRFPQEKLTQLYSNVGRFGFESFAILPIGAQLATLPSRQAVIALDRTVIAEQFSLSGSSLRPFSELTETLLDQVCDVLGVDGYRGLDLKLLALWPVQGTDAITFMSKSVKVAPTVESTLGHGFDVAGIRFHKGKVGEGEEWIVKIEPFLQQPDHLWVEIQTIYTLPFKQGKEVVSRYEKIERFLRTEVQDAIYALAGDKKGGS